MGDEISDINSRESKFLDQAMSVSLCVPSSAIRPSNACNLAHATTVAYQIARLSAIYNVNEIVVLDIPLSNQIDAAAEATIPGPPESSKKIVFNQPENNVSQGIMPEKGHDAVLLATLLQYFVTPPYLVRSLFKSSERLSLKHAVKLPSIRTFITNPTDASKNFKEGLTIPKKTPKLAKKSKKMGSKRKLQVTKFVNIGRERPFELKGQEVPVNARVTVDLTSGTVVSPQVAYGAAGCNSAFGYSVRYANSISAVYTELGVPGGYTETAFVEADDYFLKSPTKAIPKYNKKSAGTTLLLVGKWFDFEACAASDDNISSIMDVIDCELVVPRGVRIEDAAFIALAKLFDT